MKLWIVSTEDYSYDEFDSLVIASPNEDDALSRAEERLPGFRTKYKIEYIGEYAKEEAGIIHESFNSG